MDSYKEPAQPEMLELAPAPTHWITGFLPTKGPNPNVAEWVLYADVPPLRAGDEPERRVVARIVAPIALMMPMGRAIQGIAEERLQS